MKLRWMGPMILRNADGGAGSGGGGAAGNPNGGADTGAGSGNGSTNTNGANGSPFAGLSPENLQLVTSKGWADLNAPLASYRELEGKIGKSLIAPDDKADPQQWDSFFEKVGRPKTAAEYKLERPASIPADAPYDAEMAEGMKGLFHKAGLTQRQAAMLHEAVHTGAESERAAQVAADTKAVETAHQALVKDWGEPDSPGYMRNLELANRVIRTNGGAELLDEMKATGILTKGGEVKAPLFMKLLAKIGEQNYAEDTLWSGAGEYSNPFADNSLDLEAQGKIIKSDPERARALIRATGQDPANWQL